MKQIAFITFEEMPDCSPGDQLAMSAISVAGNQVQAAIWNDPSVDWQQFDLLVFRSCWDYFRHVAEFDTWLTQIAYLGIPTLNPLSIIQWNRGKHYLQDLAAQGVNVVPSVWLPQGKTAVLADILANQGWEQAVVKPVVSGTAFHTWRTTPAQAAAEQRQLDELLAKRDMMVQPFLPEIQSLGEYSLLYFDKQFSHAVLKQAINDDFRVQSDFGGTVTVVEPDETVIATGKAILDGINAPLAYARVDGVMVNGRFTLLELELVEPELFLTHSPTAPQRFADVLLQHAALLPQR